jgi:hypothetical protein
MIPDIVADQHFADFKLRNLNPFFTQYRLVQNKIERLFPLVVSLRVIAHALGSI